MTTRSHLLHKLIRASDGQLDCFCDSLSCFVVRRLRLGDEVVGNQGMAFGGVFAVEDVT